MNLYEQYRKSKFDLSAFGIERGPSRSDYFCTPKGAKIIGWTGVGGIHYCTLTAFGDTVFAVDPSGDAGRHAFPVAESFDDLLRLLMACGHEAHVEQAHSWSRDQFGRFVKDNPVSDKAREQIAYLESQFGLTPIADPYAYLKKIYEDFDLSAVPYKKDYYKYVPMEEAPQPKEWQVYFSVFNRKGGETAGTELPLNAHFRSSGCEWSVPSAYICAKGLVLDIFAEQDTFSPELDFRAFATVNGKILRESQSTGNIWTSEYRPEEMRDVLIRYGFGLDKCLLWRRISFPWATKTKPSVKSIELKLEPRPAVIEGEHFSVVSSGQKIEFIHPVTNAAHTLTVCEYEQCTLSRDRQFSGGYENPAHYVKMTYTLEPELSSNRFTVSDTKQSDAPKKSASSGRTYDFESSIVLTVPVSDKNETASAIRSACSALTFEPQEKVEWKMIFREKTVQDMQFTLL